MALVVAIAVAAATSTEATIRFTALSEPMPRLEGPDLMGGSLDRSDYRGKVVLINFWASWCDPCRDEQPGLESLWKELGPEGVRFVGVDYRDGEGPAQRYLAEFDVTYPSLLDPNGAIGAAFDIPYLPATVLVDREGQMRYRLAGAQETGFVRRLLSAMLAEGTSGGGD